MSKRERQTFEPEDPQAQVFWEINTDQLKSLIHGMSNYKNFRLINSDPSGVPLPFDFVAYYRETCKKMDYYVFVENTQEKGEFLLTASRGVIPVIRDILGANLPSPSVFL